MGIILNIDTAIDTAYISLAKDGIIIARLSNNEQKDHAGFLQPAIRQLLQNAGLSIQQLDAIAVAAGPGSYTGLRVGMATAKGLCYALNKPLITIGTLEILAFAAISEITDPPANALFCPMIDARRMEVFTALYDTSFQVVEAPIALVLDQHSFAINLLKNKIYFFGNGAKKFAAIGSHPNAVFISALNNSLAMSKLAFKKYQQNNFADLAYSEPFYLKEFFTNNLSN